MITNRSSYVALLGMGAVVVYLVHSTGCAPTLVSHKSTFKFHEIAVNLVRQGMSPDELKGMFGEPDIIYKSDFGQETEESWPGLVLKYLTVRDTTYHYVVRYRTNTFVFWMGVEPPVLDHWEIEYIRGD